MRKWFFVVLGLVCAGPAGAAQDSLRAFAENCQSPSPSSATYQRYTHGKAPAETDPSFKSWIQDPAHWTPERREQHRELVEAYEGRVEALSEELTQSPLARELGKPVLILTRGNSGSGKSFLLKNPDHPLLAKLDLPRLMRDPRFEEAAINPDVLKHTIQSELEGGKVSNGAVHEEGSMLADRIIERAFDKGLSFIVDKRFGRAAQVDKLASLAKEKGYHVIVVDVDAPLSVSTSRVTDRPVGGESPNVKFEPILQGYVEARENREAVSGLRSVDEYLAFSSTPHDPASNGLVASRSGSRALEVHKPETWERLTRVEDPEVRYARHLYEELLDLLSRAYPNEFARILGKEVYDVASVDPWNSPEHTYRVLPGDEAVLKQVQESPEVLPRRGQIHEMRIGWGKKQKYRVIETGEPLVLESLETGGRRRISLRRFQKSARTAHITEEQLQEYADTRGGSALHSLADLRYDLVKFQDREYHERLAHGVREYLQRTLPGVEVRLEPEADRVRIVIRNTDRETKVRLIQDRNWAVKLVAGSRPESPDLLIDTKDVERQNYPMIFPRPDRGIGYNGVGQATPGSPGHEFVTYGSQLDLLADIAGQPGRRIFPDSPPLFHISRGRVGFRFSSWAENGKYVTAGFRSDQGPAFHHSARVGLHEAKKLALKADSDPQARAHAIRSAVTALNHAHLADEFLGFTSYALKQFDATPSLRPIPGSRPTSMDREVGENTELKVDLHSKQLEHRQALSGTRLKAELETAARWFDAKIAANRLVRDEARRMLEEMGARGELESLERDWRSAQQYPDATPLYRD